MKLLAAFLLLLAFSVEAQLSVSQPFFLQSAPSSTFIMPQATNIYVDLDALNLASGKATSWTDSVNSVVFTNTIRGPIKEGSVLHFYGTNSLTVSGSTPAGNYFRCTNYYMVVFCQTNSVPGWLTLIGKAGAELGLFTEADALANHFNSDFQITDAMAMNVWHDVIYTGGASPKVYTNGVFSANGSTSDAGSTWAWGIIGANQNGTGDPWRGFIHRVIWWTNSTTTSLTSGDVAALHNMATNRYNYSP